MVFVLLSYGGWNEAAYLSAEIRGGARRIALIEIDELALTTTEAALRRDFPDLEYIAILGDCGDPAVIAHALARADIIPLFAAAWAPAVVALLSGLTLLFYTEDG